MEVSDAEVKGQWLKAFDFQVNSGIDYTVKPEKNVLIWFGKSQTESPGSKTQFSSFFSSLNGTTYGLRRIYDVDFTGNFKGSFLDWKNVDNQ